MKDQPKLAGLEFCTSTFFDRVWNEQHVCSMLAGHGGDKHADGKGFSWDKEQGEEMDKLTRTQALQKRTA